jgi:hypothetical protein
MKARQLIRNASYGPDHLRVLFTAFDQAWESIAGEVGSNPLAVEGARLKLANIILSLGKEAKDDPDWLKNAALQIMHAKTTVAASRRRDSAS